MIDLRMRRQIEAPSRFIFDRRDLGGPRSQPGVRFFGPMPLMGTPFLSRRDSNPHSFSIPLSAQRNRDLQYTTSDWNFTTKDARTRPKHYNLQSD
jgi:hypothetical protein